MPLSKSIIPLLILPVAALGITKYLHNHPLPASRTCTIKSNLELSPSSASSKSLRSTVNPRNHLAIPDSYTIRLSQAELRGRNDEEILATFSRGFFGGWIFTPERYLLESLQFFGLKFIPVGYSNIPSPGPLVQSLFKSTLPPKHAFLFAGNFMVLDSSIRSSSSDQKEQSNNSPSYIEIGFGDNRKGFAGMHRFEILHDIQEGNEGATLWYSSISCNPSINKLPFPSWIFAFHRFYAANLFRDGIAAVLEAR